MKFHSKIEDMEMILYESKFSPNRLDHCNWKNNIQTQSISSNEADETFEDKVANVLE